MDLAIEKITDVGDWLEIATSGAERWHVIAGTAAATLAALGLMDVATHWRDYREDVRKEIFRIVRNLPAVKKIIKKELDDMTSDVTESLSKSATEEGVISMTRLPQQGWPVDQVQYMAKKIINMGNFNWQSGRISGGSFSGNNANYTALMAKIFQITVWTNPLHFDVFPGARKMDAEIVAMTKHMLHADDTCCGCVTSGGSESLMLMLKAYRDFGASERGIQYPEAVVARTIHAAVDKAAHYLGVKLRKVDVDPVTCQASVQQMKRQINSNTILLMASAPDFSYGIIDDIEAIAALGELYSVPVHVDCCMGGFLLPFMEEAGYPLPPFDFRVKGVTSMSADNHKYGNSPKGTSVVVYRSKKVLHSQYFKMPNWPGGIYATPTVAGSRAGVNVAVCWAAMLYHGRASYVEITGKIISNARKLKEQIGSIPELELLGDPLTSIVSAKSDTVNMLTLVDLMHDKGWHLITLQNPPGLQICLTKLHTETNFVDQLMEDLRATVKHLVNYPNQETTGIGKIYGMATKIPDKTLITDAANLYLDGYYNTPQE